MCYVINRRFHPNRIVGETRACSSLDYYNHYHTSRTVIDAYTSMPGSRSIAARRDAYLLLGVRKFREREQIKVFYEWTLVLR